MDRGAWRGAHGVAKSRTQLKQLSTHTHTHTALNSTVKCGHMCIRGLRFARVWVCVGLGGW